MTALRAGRAARRARAASVAPPHVFAGVRVALDLLEQKHVLIAPEGDLSRRRHAHTECVLKARQAGGMLSKEEWLKTQPQPPRRPLRQRLAELLGRGQRAPGAPE